MQFVRDLVKSFGERDGSNPAVDGSEAQSLVLTHPQRKMPLPSRPAKRDVIGAHCSLEPRNRHRLRRRLEGRARWVVGDQKTAALPAPEPLDLEASAVLCTCVLHENHAIDH